MKVQTVEQFLKAGGTITKIAAEAAPVNNTVNAKGKAWTQVSGKRRPGAMFRG